MCDSKIDTYIHTCVCVHTYIYIYVYMYICIYVYINDIIIALNTRQKFHQFSTSPAPTYVCTFVKYLCFFCIIILNYILY